jgi:hypothetical protein
MKRYLLFIAAISVAITPLIGGGTVRVYQRPKAVLLDNVSEALIKRVPQGDDLVLTVNKGENVTGYRIQWYKDGQPLTGEDSQELRRPMATEAENGEYTVQMSSPCATVMSKPITVIVQPREFLINTHLPSGEGVAGSGESYTSQFELKACQPNPVTDRATITFITHVEAQVTLKLVDLNGNVVATLVNDVLPIGEHDVTISTSEHQMSSSMYYYVLTAPGYTDTKPLMIVK